MVSALRRISSFSSVISPGMRMARPGRERMAADKGRRQLSSRPRARTSSLKLAQRFDQLELHVIRQAADIMMALDGDEGPPVAETLSITSG